MWGDNIGPWEFVWVHGYLWHKLFGEAQQQETDWAGEEAPIEWQMSPRPQVADTGRVPIRIAEVEAASALPHRLEPPIPIIPAAHVVAASLPALTASP